MATNSTKRKKKRKPVEIDILAEVRAFVMSRKAALKARHDEAVEAIGLWEAIRDEARKAIEAVEAFPADEAEPAPRRSKRTTTGSGKRSEEANQNRAAILAALADQTGLSPAELAEKTGIKKNLINGSLIVLRRHHKVIVKSHGRYALPTAPGANGEIGQADATT